MKARVLDNMGILCGPGLFCWCGCPSYSFLDIPPWKPCQENEFNRTNTWDGVRALRHSNMQGCVRCGADTHVSEACRTIARMRMLTRFAFRILVPTQFCSTQSVLQMRLPSTWLYMQCHPMHANTLHMVRSHGHVDKATRVC